MRLQSEIRQRTGRAFDPALGARFVTETIEHFTSDLFAAVRARGIGNHDRRPIFVIGMPRSGTTLVEQVLASHPRIFGAGERKDVPRLYSELAGGTEQPTALVRSLLDRDPAGLRLIVERTLARLESLEPGRARHIVDKLPENYLFLGLIAALWPEARVIHCRRDVRDVALSCWSNFLNDIRWSDDLRHIAQRIVEHDRLNEHWRAVLPCPLITVDYEALVRDFEPQVRRLLAALDLGLAFDPACLVFHTMNRTVRTASMNQVRSPINSRSIGRWKNYEAALAPLFETFATMGYRPDAPVPLSRS